MKKEEKIINEIFDKKKHIVKDKNTKTLISNYPDFIPMYDIYSGKIYPITKENIYYRLIDCHYRFLTNDIVRWIENKYKKYKDEINKDNLEIIKNYDIDLLIKNSYHTLYEPYLTAVSSN